MIACASDSIREENVTRWFVESKSLRQNVDAGTRLALLEKFQEKGLTPLIRSARMSCYEQSLLGPDRADEMEREVAAWTEAEDERTYIRGDVFCFEDFVLFLIFGDDEEEAAAVRAGIVYGAEMLEPEKKLDAFCRNVSDALEATRSSASSNGAADDDKWERRDSRAVASLGRVTVFLPADDLARCGGATAASTLPMPHL